MYLSPVFVITVYPILAIYLRNIDILSHPKMYAVVLVASLGVAFPVMIWIYKHWYEKKLNNANSLLKELEKFEQEN
jgi:hypothetical protein